MHLHLQEKLQDETKTAQDKMLADQVINQIQTEKDEMINLHDTLNRVQSDLESLQTQFLLQDSSPEPTLEVPTTVSK